MSSKKSGYGCQLLIKFVQIACAFGETSLLSLLACVAEKQEGEKSETTMEK